MTDELLKSPLKKGINWYRAFVLVFAALGALSPWTAQLYLDQRYVSQERNKESWGKQLAINDSLAKDSLAISTILERDNAQDNRLSALETDMRDLRRSLYPNRQ